MNNTLLIYFWGQADSIRGLFVIIAVVSGLATLFNLLWKSLEDNDVKIYKTPPALLIFSALFATLLPSPQTIAAMVIIPQIANSAAIQKDLPELYDMAVKKLKAELE